MNCVPSNCEPKWVLPSLSLLCQVCHSKEQRNWYNLLQGADFFFHWNTKYLGAWNRKVLYEHRRSCTMATMGWGLSTSSFMVADSIWVINRSNKLLLRLHYKIFLLQGPRVWLSGRTFAQYAEGGPVFHPQNKTFAYLSANSLVMLSSWLIPSWGSADTSDPTSSC